MIGLFSYLNLIKLNFGSKNVLIVFLIALWNTAIFLVVLWKVICGFLERKQDGSQQRLHAAICVAIHPLCLHSGLQPV
jgi:hypothetical protein